MAADPPVRGCECDASSSQARISVSGLISAAFAFCWKAQPRDKFHRRILWLVLFSRWCACRPRDTLRAWRAFPHSSSGRAAQISFPVSQVCLGSIQTRRSWSLGERLTVQPSARETAALALTYSAYIRACMLSARWCRSFSLASSPVRVRLRRVCLLQGPSDRRARGYDIMMMARHRSLEQRQRPPASCGCSQGRSRRSGVQLLVHTAHDLPEHSRPDETPARVPLHDDHAHGRPGARPLAHVHHACGFTTVAARAYTPLRIRMHIVHMWARRSSTLPVCAFSHSIRTLGLSPALF